MIPVEKFVARADPRPGRQGYHLARVVEGRALTKTWRVRSAH